MAPPGTPPTPSSILSSISSGIKSIGANAGAATTNVTALDNIMNKVMDGGAAIYKYWEKINTSTLSVTKNFGGSLKSITITNSYSKLLSDNIKSAGVELTRLGSSAELALQFVGELTDKSGTFVGVTEKGLNSFAYLTERIGDVNVKELSKDLISVGYSLESSGDFMKEMVFSSQKMGLNSKKVAEAVSANFKALSRYSFKGGATEMAKMAQNSVMLGGNLASAAAKLKDLRSPEKAIEFAQQMQMYGGTIAQELGDANEILRMSRSGAEGLKEYQLKLAKSAASLMTNVNGQFVAMEGNLDIMDGFIEKSQMTADEFQEMSTKMAKITELSSKYNLGLPTEDLNVLQGFIDFSKSTNGKIQLTGVDKLSEKLTGDLGIDSKGMIDANNFTTEKMGALVEALKATTKETEKPKTADEAIKGQVNASINLTDQVTRLSTQLLGMSPNLATIANNVTTKDKDGNDLGKTIGDNIRLGFDNLNKISSLPEVAESIEGLGTKFTEIGASITGGLVKLTDEVIKNPNSLNIKNLNEGIKAFSDLLIKAKAKGGIVEYGSGGLFNGPSHKQGGIPVTTKGSGNMFEVEGGEAIINKKSTAMFKPLLSSINELGGGVKFAMGGISSPMASRSTQMGSNGTSNINVGSSSPININVNVNGSVAIDGKNFKISDEEKEKLSISIKNTFMSEVFSNINKGEAFTGKKTKPNYIFND